MRIETIENDVWNELDRCRDQTDHGWRLPVLGTGSIDWDFRTVVLRDVDKATRVLFCHSDVRAPKVSEIQDDSTTRWLFYDGRFQVQVKVVADTHVVTTGDVADEQWAATPLSSRRAYLAPRVPGTRVSQPDNNLPEQFQERLPTESEVEAGRENFAVIVAKVRQFEWLGLFRTGNLRAVVEYANDDDLKFDHHWIAS